MNMIWSVQKIAQAGTGSNFQMRLPSLIVAREPVEILFWTSCYQAQATRPSVFFWPDVHNSGEAHSQWD